jgi:glucokinase
MKAAGPILSADVGGTHLRLALLAPEGPRFHLLRKARFDTQAHTSLLEPVQAFLAAEPTLRPQAACFAGAGPVVGRRLALTNAPWDLEADALEAALGFPVHLVNDFTALTHGVRHLDLSDQQQVTPLLPKDARRPTPDPAGPQLVVGAGTGLGVGFAIPGAGVLPSEGGHLGLPIFDDTSLALWRHLAEGLPGPPGAELAVSGPGLARIFWFLLDTGRVPATTKAQAILALPTHLQPEAIAIHAGTDPACGQAMALLVALFARVCSDLSMAFLPAGGLFLGGGLVAKNPDAFLRDAAFRTRF